MFQVESLRLPQPRGESSLAAVRILTVLALALPLALPGVATAQGRRWVVLSATTSDDHLATALDVGEHSGAALTASGEIVIPRDQATSRIEAQLSQPYRAAPDELVRRIGQAMEQAVEDVAFGRNQRALDRGVPLLAELDPHIAGLGRNEQAARDITNLCLFMVRAHVQKRDAGAARQQAQLCMRLVPDLHANPEVHPPAVLELLQEHRQRLDEGQGGILAIHASPTDPAGCAIRVNGRTLGESPMIRVTIPPGTYLVQMECTRGRPGRLHTVTVTGDEPTRVVLQARLAQALETRPGLALIYTDAASSSDQLAADVAALGRVLEANRVLVVVHDGAHATLRAFGIAEGEVAEITGSAPVPEPIGDETSRAAVREVIAGRRLGEPSEAPVAEAPPTSAQSVETGSGSDVVPPIVGASLLTLGAVGVGIGWYFWTELDARGQDLATAGGTTFEITAAQAAFDDAFLPVALSAGIGSALATVGLPLLLPREDDFPWWSLAVGAVGLGVASVGIYYVATDGEGSCYGNDCLRRMPHGLLGASLLANAVPLISVPVIYAIRLGTSSPEADQRPAASVSVLPTGTGFSVMGSF